MIHILSEMLSFTDMFPDAIRKIRDSAVYDEAELEDDREMVAALGKYDVIVTCSQHFWTEEVFSKATRTRLLIRVGKGVDNVNIHAARKYGIKVANTGSSNAGAVAEHTMALILASTHNLPESDRQLHEGDWEHIRQMHELRELTIGLAGFGAIPQTVAVMLRGFAPKSVIAYDPFADFNDAERLNVEIVDFPELLRRSDIISVHVPLLSDTYHMFDRTAFSKMKDEVIFISIARGGLVDEEALYSALCSGKVSWAGMDVFEQEPLPADNKLLTLPNVFGTPHSAAHTYAASQETTRIAIEELFQYLNGEEVQNIVN